MLLFKKKLIKLTEKIRGYKKQVDETTDNANQAMTKYKKLANDLDNWNERAEMAEDAVKQARAKANEKTPNILLVNNEAKHHVKPKR